MRLPIRNTGDRPLTIFLEPMCSEYEIPVGGEAIVRLEDGSPHSVEISESWVTIWDEGREILASVEIISLSDKRVDEALMLVNAWLHGFGAETQAKCIDQLISDLEPDLGYFKARRQVFEAFHDGLITEEQGRLARKKPWSESLAPCYQAGVQAARFNQLAREKHSFPEVSAAAPLDTVTVRSAFARALADDS